MKRKLLLIIGIIPSIFFAQNLEETPIFDAYSKHFETPREYVHVHLNKSTLLQGEQLGFSAYVLDAYKKPSLTATNLYCTITDSTNAIVKKKLLMVQKGFSNNIFEIDSLLPPGEYRFNSYTNYQRNFNEKLYFSRPITVLGPDSVNQSRNRNNIAEIDIQVFPEGGHLLQNIENTLGVLVKNQFQQGVGIEEAALVNHIGDTLSIIKLDKMGIGKTKLRPVEDEDYFLNVSFGSTDYSIPIKDIKQRGVLLNLERYGKKVLVKAITNLKTLEAIKKQVFVLAMHNSKSIKTWTFTFEKGPRLELLLDEDTLLKGMNVFTLFNDKRVPIAERLCFNYNLPVLETSSPLATTVSDSTRVRIKIPKGDPAGLNNLSVSVLPKSSKAFDKKNNMVSNLFLKPFVKGYIQDASYYFTKPNNKTKYDLDNLLITQGWSSFSWNAIFNSNEVLKYPYEQGITFKASINNKLSENSFIIQPMAFTKSFIFNLDGPDNYFEATPLFPVDGDAINISEIKASGKLEKPNIVPMFSPRTVPNLELDFFNEIDQNKTAQLTNYDEFKINLNEVQQLDEITLNAVVEQTRYERLKKLTRGSLDVFDDIKREAYADFGTYIASKGFIVNQNVDRIAGQPLLQIYNPVRTSFGAAQQSPLIILDGIILTDLSILYNFKMSTVDYIEVDKSGASMGMRGANGVIRIVTDPSKLLKQKTFKGSKSIEIPLKFSKPERYYAPKYQSYSSSFFRNFGIIDWFPDLKLDRTGAIDFTFNSFGNKDFVLVVEGIVNGEYFVSDLKTISID